MDPSRRPRLFRTAYPPISTSTPWGWRRSSCHPLFMHAPASRGVPENLWPYPESFNPFLANGRYVKGTTCRKEGNSGFEQRPEERAHVSVLQRARAAGLLPLWGLPPSKPMNIF